MKQACEAFGKLKKVGKEDKFGEVATAFVQQAQSRVDKLLAEADEAKADVEKVGDVAVLPLPPCRRGKVTLSAMAHGSIDV